MSLISDTGLRFGALGPNSLHLSVDMQNLFAGDSPWATPWMSRILPNVQRLAEAHARDTIFTRFIPAARAAEAPGAWRRYYEYWSDVTLDRLAPRMIDLMAPLAALVPPAEIFDKTTYGPWQDGDLHRRLKARGVDTLVMTGGETDVCVLAAVLGAVDLGYRVVLAADALCSAEDETHDATMTLYRRRYDRQIEVATTDAVLAHWP